jgi:hypothetical protein
MRLVGWLAGMCAVAGCARAEPDGLYAVPDRWGVGEIRWVDGGRATTLERFPAPEVVVETERSPDGRWAFAWHKPDGQPQQLSVYDLARGERVSGFAPGFGGSIDFTPQGHLAHRWGCGSGCSVLRVLDRGGAVRFEATAGSVEIAPGAAWALLIPGWLDRHEPLRLVDLDGARVAAAAAPWEVWGEPVGPPVWSEGRAEVPIGDDVAASLWLAADGTTGWTLQPPAPEPGWLTAGRAAAIVALAAAGADRLTLDRGGFSARDEVLVVQLVGEGAGQWALATVEAVEPDGVTLYTGLPFAVGPGAQLVEVVSGGHLRVDGSLAVPPWDGAVGGVLAVRAGRLTVDGEIVASGAGLRGGRRPGARGAQSCLAGDDPRSAERGEGHDGAPRGLGFDRPSSGGGGGGCHNAGGGGGGGAGAGGQGGFSWINEANSRGDVGGRGGLPAPLMGLFAGGGGGAGQSDRPEAPGGGGGGVVWVDAQEIVGGGWIRARGADGHGPEREGAGGGGGGGTVWLDADRVAVRVDVSGGRGANSLEDALGPGGGGGGGRFVGPEGVEVLLDGGGGGVDPRGDPYGAAPGAAGQRGAL